MIARMAVTGFALIGSGNRLNRWRDAIAARHDARLCAADTMGDDVDAVIIALPPALAIEAAGAALDKKIATIIELTGEETVEQMVDLRHAERDAGSVILKFGCQLRYHKSVRHAREIAASGTFGKLKTIRAIYGLAGRPANAPANALAHLGLPLLDLVQAFSGPFEGLTAMSATGGNAPSPTAENVFAILTTGNGVAAQLHCSHTQWRQTFRLELGLETGYLWLDGLAVEGLGPEMLIAARSRPDIDSPPEANPHEEIRQFRSDDSTHRELADFMEALQARKSGLVDGSSQQAFDTINTLQRLLASDPYWAPA